MAEHSKIEWCDATFNPWLGCEKISPACDRCYAESWAKRTGSPELWRGERRRTTAAYWRQPIKWNTHAAKTGIRPRVFCASLADVFDNAVPADWRRDLWDLIRRTPNLDFLILTKRIGNARIMLPGDWQGGYRNVWLGITCCDQDELDRDTPKLQAVPAIVHFLSLEPLLGSVAIGAGCPPYPRVDWVIAGGESGHGARAMHPDWVRRIRDDCERDRIAFLFKQWGEFIPGDQDESRHFTYEDENCEHSWDDDRITYSIRVGKKAAGRILDGRTHDQFPTPTP